MRDRPRLVLACLAAALAIVALVACAVGALSIPLGHAAALLAAGLGIGDARGVAPIEQAVFLAIRLPRCLLGLAVGGILGMAGTAFQALFHNPLADAALIGVAGGGACGAVAAIVFGGCLAGLGLGLDLDLGGAGPWLTQICAFLGSLAATAAVCLVARGAQAPDRPGPTLLLAGVAVNAATGAILGYLTYQGNDAQLRQLTFWLLGGLGGASWAQIRMALPVIALAAAGFLGMARRYDILALGERDAVHLGLSVQRVRRQTILLGALGVGASVALTGTIGFVGLAAPHLVRLIGGGAHRFVMPASALMGALLVVLADLLARTLVAPAELPIGIVTSGLGAPFFIWILRRRERGAP